MGALKRRLNRTVFCTCCLVFRCPVLWGPAELSAFFRLLWAAGHMPRMGVGGLGFECLLLHAEKRFGAFLNQQENDREEKS